jgi:hypothetical protein
MRRLPVGNMPMRSLRACRRAVCAQERARTQCPKLVQNESCAHSNPARPATYAPPSPNFTVPPSKAEIAQKRVKRDALRRIPANPAFIAFSQLRIPNYWFPTICENPNCVPARLRSGATSRLYRDGFVAFRSTASFFTFHFSFFIRPSLQPAA